MSFELPSIFTLLESDSSRPSTTASSSQASIHNNGHISQIPLDPHLLDDIDRYAMDISASIQQVQDRLDQYMAHMASCTFQSIQVGHASVQRIKDKTDPLTANLLGIINKVDELKHDFIYVDALHAQIQTVKVALKRLETQLGSSEHKRAA